MSTIKSSLPVVTSRWAVGLAATLLLGAVAACGTDSNDAGPSDDPSSATASSETPSADADEASPSADPDSTTDEQDVVLTVEGEKDEGLVKAMVVTTDSKHGGPMLREALPFSHEVSLPPTTELIKVLVIAKYPDGDTGEISCAVTIDGETAASNSSRGHRPAKCHVTPSR